MNTDWPRMKLTGGGRKRWPDQTIRSPTIDATVRTQQDGRDVKRPIDPGDPHT